jgi:hypothetical protein
MSGFGQTVTMQRLAHILSCLILALALVLNGPGSVGPAKGAIMVTLCAGDAPATIWLDVDGNPVLPGQTHAKCLDCLLFAAPLPRTFSLLPLHAPLHIRTGLNQPVAVVPWQTAYLHPDSRGPPPAQADAFRNRDLCRAVQSRLQSTLLQLDEYQAILSIRATV